VLCLVVDDDPNICRKLRRDLERLGHTVVTAHSPLEAIDALRTNCFQLALIDYELGHPLTGLDVGRHAPRNCALIMVSGHSPEEMRGRWEDPLKGFLAVVGKPELFGLTVLVHRVEEMQEITKP
jgi:CheY-like chemotaxis protein